MSSDDRYTAENKTGAQTAKTESSTGVSTAIKTVEVGLNESLLSRNFSLCQVGQGDPSVVKPEDFPNRHIDQDEDLILMGICGPVDGGTDKENLKAPIKQGSATNNGRTPRWTPEEVHDFAPH